MTRSKAIDDRLLALDAILHSGRPMSALESLCVQRQIGDLQRNGTEGLHWSEEEAVRACSFARLHYHWQGKKAGTPFEPEPWQDQLTFAPLFGWKRETPNGLRRRFTVGYEEIPRKNGKSFKSAVIGNQGLMADGENGPEVYAAATTRDQAAIVFRDAKGTSANSKFLQRHLRVMRNAIQCPANNGTFQAVSSDYNFLQGKKPSRVIIDELHAHRNRDVWDALLTGMGARENPLLFAITTAGHDRSTICWEQHEFARGILEGHFREDTFFTFIACADADDDPFDPLTWAKANPNLDISIEREFLATEARKASRSSSYENTFRRLHLNQWTQQSIRWVPMHLWDACRREYTESDLLGRPCFAAADFASTRDVNALVLLFPMESNEYRMLCWFWIPEDTGEARAEQDRRQLLNWADQGWIRKTQGNVSDFDDQIPNDILEILARFDVTSLAYDPHGNAAAVMQKLVNRGFSHEKLVEFRQGIMHMSGPSQEFERMVASQKLHHNGNQVMRWMVSNTAVKMDSSGNIKPDKEKSADKIDGVVSMVMAVGEAKFAEQDNHSWDYQPGELAL